MFPVDSELCHYCQGFSRGELMMRRICSCAVMSWCTISINMTFLSVPESRRTGKKRACSWQWIVISTWELVAGVGRGKLLSHQSRWSSCSALLEKPIVDQRQSNSCWWSSSLPSYVTALQSSESLSQYKQWCPLRQKQEDTIISCLLNRSKLANRIVSMTFWVWHISATCWLGMGSSSVIKTLDYWSESQESCLCF